MKFAMLNHLRVNLRLSAVFVPATDNPCRRIIQRRPTSIDRGES